MYVSLMYRLWKILLSNMSRPETFRMTLVSTRLLTFVPCDKMAYKELVALVPG